MIWKGESFLFVVVLLVFGAIFAAIHTGGLIQKQDSVQLLNKGWYYIKDGKKQEITLPAEIPAKTGEKLILYWLFEISYYGSIFELGNLVFLVLVIADAVMMMADNVRYRLESQAYERLSREDGMTGLETRANFEKKLESISADMGRYRDILLMYIDIDQLRVINEEYGRAAGDEMVVISARCVENVFREKGTCYRIGGDEFAVLVYDPEVPDEFWPERLKEELRNIGRGCRHRFSLSLGCSHLRNKDGSLKSMGEWKYEADRKLYENKKKGDLKNGVY